MKLQQQQQQQPNNEVIILAFENSTKLWEKEIAITISAPFS